MLKRMNAGFALSLRFVAATFAFVALTVVANTEMQSVCTLESHAATPWVCTLWMFSPVLAAAIAGVLVSMASPAWSVVCAIVVIFVGLCIAVPMNYTQGWHGSDLGYALGMALVGCFIPAIAASSLACHYQHWRARNAP